MALTNRTTAEHYRWGDVCDGWRLLDTEHLSVIEERMIVMGNGRRKMA